MTPFQFIDRTSLLVGCPTLCVMVLLSGLLAHHAGAAENEVSALQAIGAQQIVGAYPENLRALPDGGFAFITYGADGNGRLQHIVTVPEYVDTPLVQFSYNTTPIAWSDKYIVANSIGFYLILDRQSGERVNRRKFTEFSAGEQLVQFDGQELVVAVYKQDGGTAFRRVAVPELKVTERVDVPFSGQFLRYGDKLVGLGNFFATKYRGTPSVVVVDKQLQIEKSVAIDASKPRDNSGCGFNAPTIHSHYLIYGADCGGVRVFDLTTMKEVARRERLGESYFYTFAVGSNQLAAVMSYSEQGILDALLFEFPSLKPIRSFQLNGMQALASADRIYSIIEPNRERVRAPYKSELNSYRMAPATSQGSAIELAFSKAIAEWQKGTKYSAIQTFESIAPSLLPQDVAGLSDSEKQAAAWYAGLLASTQDRRQSGLDLLEVLAKAKSKEDAKITRLINALNESHRESQIDEQASQSFMRAKVSVTGGSLPGMLAWSDRYFVIATWCGTTNGAVARTKPGTIDHKIVAATNATAEARDLCRRGYPGIAVHAADDLSLQRFVSLVASDDVVQENISSVTVIGDMAYAAIERRYPEVGDINLVAVDLRNGSIAATRALPATPSIKSDGRSLLSCGPQTGSGCEELDPVTLAPGQVPVLGVDESKPISPHDFQSNRNHSDTPHIVSLEKYQLTRSPPSYRNVRLVIGELPTASKETTLPKVYESISQGILSPDGRFAYVLANAIGARANQLIRVELESGEVAQLSDGTIGDLIEFGKYFLISNGTAIDVFDRESGRFLCRWPAILDNKYKEQLVAKGNTLLMIYSSSQDTSLTPSTVIDLQALGAASEMRAKRIRELNKTVEIALAALAP